MKFEETKRDEANKELPKEFVLKRSEVEFVGTREGSEKRLMPRKECPEDQEVYLSITTPDTRMSHGIDYWRVPSYQVPLGLDVVKQFQARDTADHRHTVLGSFDCDVEEAIHRIAANFLSRSFQMEHGDGLWHDKVSTVMPQAIEGMEPVEEKQATELESPWTPPALSRDLRSAPVSTDAPMRTGYLAQPPYNYGVSEGTFCLGTIMDYPDQELPYPVVTPGNGRTWVIVPSVHKRKHIGDFYLRIHSKRPFTCKLVTEAVVPDSRETRLEELRERFQEEVKRVGLTTNTLEARVKQATQQTELKPVEFKRLLQSLDFSLTGFPDEDLKLLCCRFIVGMRVKARRLSDSPRVSDGIISNVRMNNTFDIHFARPPSKVPSSLRIDGATGKYAFRVTGVYCLVEESSSKKHPEYVKEDDPQVLIYYLPSFKEWRIGTVGAKNEAGDDTKFHEDGHRKPDQNDGDADFFFCQNSEAISPAGDGMEWNMLIWSPEHDHSPPPNNFRKAGTLVISADETHVRDEMIEPDQDFKETHGNEEEQTISIDNFLGFLRANKASLAQPEQPKDDLLYQPSDLQGELTIQLLAAKHIKPTGNWFSNQLGTSTKRCLEIRLDESDRAKVLKMKSKKPLTKRRKKHSQMTPRVLHGDPEVHALMDSLKKRLVNLDGSREKLDLVSQTKDELEQAVATLEQDITPENKKRVALQAQVDDAKGLILLMTISMELSDKTQDLQSKLDAIRDDEPVSSAMLKTVKDISRVTERLPDEPLGVIPRLLSILDRKASILADPMGFQLKTQQKRKIEDSKALLAQIEARKLHKGAYFREIEASARTSFLAAAKVRMHKTRDPRLELRLKVHKRNQENKVKVIKALEARKQAALNHKLADDLYMSAYLCGVDGFDAEMCEARSCRVTARICHDEKPESFQRCLDVLKENDPNFRPHKYLSWENHIEYTWGADVEVRFLDDAETEDLPGSWWLATIGRARVDEDGDCHISEDEDASRSGKLWLHVIQNRHSLHTHGHFDCDVGPGAPFRRRKLNKQDGDFDPSATTQLGGHADLPTEEETEQLFLIQKTRTDAFSHPYEQVLDALPLYEYKRQKHNHQGRKESKWDNLEKIRVRPRSFPIGEILDSIIDKACIIAQSKDRPHLRTKEQLKLTMGDGKSGLLSAAQAKVCSALPSVFLSCCCGLSHDSLHPFICRSCPLLALFARHGLHVRLAAYSHARIPHTARRSKSNMPFRSLGALD